VSDIAAPELLPFVTVTNWVRSAARCGFNIEPLLRRAGLDLQKLHPTEARIALPALLQLMNDCVDQARLSAPDLHFPQVLGETFAFDYLSDIETFITTSPTLRDASPALQWLPKLLNPVMELSLHEMGHMARLKVSFAHATTTPQDTWHFTEAVMVTFCKVARLLLGQEMGSGEVTFIHTRTPGAPAWTNALGVPMRWGCELNALWFERRLLDRPLRGSLPSLHELAAQRVNEQLARQAGPTTTATSHAANPTAARVRQLLQQRQELLGQGLPGIAQALAMHPRTLQRRLKEEGLPLSTLLDEVRHALATQWLAQGNSSIETIGLRLGFTDRRSFTQAFTRWTGVPPSHWRRQGNPSNGMSPKLP
jgi:AraC-like DNA-binding protein